MKATEIWYLVLKELQKNYYLGNASYMSYIEPLTPICVKDNFLVVMGPNLFTINIVTRKYRDVIDNAVKSINPNLNFMLIPESEKDKYEAEEYVREEVNDRVERPQFNPKYIFENFVVGSSNSYAQATAYAISQNPGAAFNPFFICGKSGLGKTHLMQAIGQEILKRNPDYKLWYVPAEQFANEFVYALNTNKNEKFRQRYRYLDCLLIDDIQFLENKPKIQDEFFHTFNALYSRGAQIVLASDKLPREIKTLSERLMTRFEQGVVVEIVMPCLEERKAILQNFKALEKYEIPDKIIDILAQNVDTSIRELEASLRRVNAYSLIDNVPPSEEIVDMVLNQMKIERIESAKVDVAVIIEKTAKAFNLSPDDILGRSKRKDIILARHSAMYIVRELTDLSFPGIGYKFNRDHTSIMHAYDKMKELTAKDESINRKVNEIIKDIKK